MRIEPFTLEDIEPFLLLSKEEGWLCERDEFRFLLNAYPQGCFVARGASGGGWGYITSIVHRKSGWIGNLIVAGEERRKGLGTLLMQKCLGTLSSSGVETVWLTASTSGAPLYERLGFRAVDRIARWRLDRIISVDSIGGSSEKSIHALVRQDRLGWGDDRERLCREAVRQGKLVVDSWSSMVLRRIETGTLVGPWSACRPLMAARLLDIAMSDSLAGEGATVLDVPERNHHATEVLMKYGFQCCSETVLMYLGEVPDYRADHIFALASTGSMG